MAPLFYNVA
jgi:hypothetical protein